MKWWSAFVLTLGFACLGWGESSSHQNTPIRGARQGLYHSIWPATLADLWRTSAVVHAGLPKGVQSSSLVTSSVELPPDPVFGITYNDHTVFVLGGTPFLLSTFTDQLCGTSCASPPDASVYPYVAKVDTRTMAVKVLELPKREKVVNYIGAMIAHRNRMIYAVASATLFEIDPRTLTITRSAPLPLPTEIDAVPVYNALTIWPATGDLILKRADFSGATPDELMLVDLQTFDVFGMTPTELGASRLSVVVGKNATYVYASARTQTVRYVVSKEGFTLDESWSATYRTDSDGTQQGGGVIYMGDFNVITFANNGTVLTGVSAPLRIYAQPTSTDSPDLMSDLLGSDNRGGTFAIPSADPYRSGMIAALDPINGIVTGWQLGQDANLSNVWEIDGLKSSAGSAIGVNQRQLYIDDYVCPENGGTPCLVSLDVVDLQTGEVMATTPVAGTLPTVGHIFVGKHEVFYISTEAGQAHGFLTRITARRCHRHAGRGDGGPRPLSCGHLEPR